jgi:hypothetical protein
VLPYQRAAAGAAQRTQRKAVATTVATRRRAIERL